MFRERPRLNPKSAECLEDFPLPEYQNIRKAVLCVLPKEFCVRRSEKDPMIQGLHKVQPALSLLAQLYKIHSNILRIFF